MASKDLDDGTRPSDQVPSTPESFCSPGSPTRTETEASDNLSEAIAAQVQAALVQALKKPSAELQQLLYGGRGPTEPVLEGTDHRGHDGVPTQLLGSSAVDCDRSKAHVEDHVVEQQAEGEHGELEPAPKRPCDGNVEEDFDPSSEPGQNRPAVDDHVRDYAAKLLSHVLTREERAAILKDWPRPTGKTFDTPSIDAYLPNLLKVSASCPPSVGGSASQCTGCHSRWTWSTDKSMAGSPGPAG